MLVRSRVKPVAIIAALVLMIAALLYVAFNRSHTVAPETLAPEPLVTLRRIPRGTINGA
jgi:hypothetical protein